MYIPGKEKHVLLYLAHGPAYLVRVHIPDVNAVDGDTALLYVIVSSDEIENRTFSGAGGPHKGNGLSWLNDKAHIPQHPLLSVVGKPDMVEFDPAENR